MGLFERRRDKQIPKTPVSQDKAVQNWMDSVGTIINKYFFGGGNDRIVTAQELIDGGIAGAGSGGFLTSPPKNLTKPPKVSGLTANGAFASIFVQWSNPAFSNYGYTELWRADIDDIGMAVLIASTAVESYTDNVGSSATKYYWARAVSDQGVKGDFNAAAGTKGETSFNPDYVKQILTSLKWQANTTYAPYQYVQPTNENGFQYVVIDGGKSASVEPTWPTTVGLTVSDGTVEWKCVAATDRLPLVIGQLEDGTPAVFIDTAFIKNASITSAKIGDLVADKITTGDLNADLHVLSKLWYGFSEFANPSKQTGFWIGVESGVPKIKIDTGLSGGNKYIAFDGTKLTFKNVDLVSSADGEFDDLKGDSVNFNRANFDFLAFGEQVTASQYIVDNNISIGDPKFEQYLCYPNGCQKTQYWKSPVFTQGYGYSRNFSFFQTGNFDKIVPYNKADNTTRYRALDKNIGFSIKVDAILASKVGNYYGGSYLDIYIFSEQQSLSSNFYESFNQTDGIPNAYLLKIPVTYQVGGIATAYKNTGSGDVAVFYVDVVIDQQINPNQTLIICDDDLGVLDYQVGRTLKVCTVYKPFFQAGPGKDGQVPNCQIIVEMQVVSSTKKINNPKNDDTLVISPRAGSGQQIAMFTQAELKTINELIAWWNRPAPL